MSMVVEGRKGRNLNLPWTVFVRGVGDNDSREPLVKNVETKDKTRRRQEGASTL
jgi:hypothetical protein